MKTIYPSGYIEGYEIMINGKKYESEYIDLEVNKKYSCSFKYMRDFGEDIGIYPIYKIFHLEMPEDKK